MNSYLASFRAITAEYVLSLLRPAAFVTFGLYGALLVLIGYLAWSLSPWWWLFAVPFTLLVIVLSAIFGLLYVVARRLEPRHLEHQERRQIKAFTKKLLRISENSRTPYPLILLLIAKDVIRGRESRFLRDLIDDSQSLLGDFRAIQQLFSS